MNAGYNYRNGIKSATKEYVMLLPAPDMLQMESLEDFLKHIGERGIIFAYIANRTHRPLYRRAISFNVTNTLNLLFGLHLKYFFGLQAYKSDIIKRINTSTNSFALLPELLIRTIKERNDYLEMPYYVRPLKLNKTTAFRLRNILGVIKTILKLFVELRLGILLGSKKEHSDK